MNHQKILYWLCVACVVFNAYVFLTTGSIIALIFGGLCAYSLWAAR